MCEYQYYNENEDYYPRLYCKIKSGLCMYSKRCDKEQKYVALENQKECYIYNMEKLKEIPQDSNYIRFEKRGFLYVEYGEDVIKIPNTFGELNQDYLYLRKTDKGFEASLTPFPKKRGRKKNEEKGN